MGQEQQRGDEVRTVTAGSGQQDCDSDAADATRDWDAAAAVVAERRQSGDAKREPGTRSGAVRRHRPVSDALDGDRAADRSDGAERGTGLCFPVRYSAGEVDAGDAQSDAVPAAACGGDDVHVGDGHEAGASADAAADVVAGGRN